MESPASSADQDELPGGLLSADGIDRLHVGGAVRTDGWEVFDAVPGDHVDHVGDVRDLTRFDDASFDVVYASHVLEHLGYQADLMRVVSSVARILRPAGKFFISVPDLEVLCRLFLQADPPEGLRFGIMRIMFGGQENAHDFHYIGLWDDLRRTLLDGGFTRVIRVPTFDLFDDTSNLRVQGQLISLNMVALRGDMPRCGP